jgi:hypothetical protein
MYEGTDLEEYMAEIRQSVCAHCIERPPGGPPCAPRGKRCGIELNLAQLVDSVHGVHATAIDPYIEKFHEDVCTFCPNRPTNQCPCPLEYLLTLAVQAIETVDEHRADHAPKS